MIPVSEATCLGGPLDGRRLVLHRLVPIHLADGQLAGYLADDQPLATDEGACALVDPETLVWTTRQGPRSGPGPG